MTLFAEVLVSDSQLTSSVWNNGCLRLCNRSGLGHWKDWGGWTEPNKPALVALSLSVTLVHRHAWRWGLLQSTVSCRAAASGSSRLLEHVDVKWAVMKGPPENLKTFSRSISERLIFSPLSVEERRSTNLTLGSSASSPRSHSLASSVARTTNSPANT